MAQWAPDNKTTLQTVWEIQCNMF